MYFGAWEYTLCSVSTQESHGNSGTDSCDLYLTATVVVCRVRYSMPEMLVAWRLVTWPNHSADFRRALYLRQFSNEARRIMAAMIRFLVALLSVGSYALILPNKPAALPAVATTVSGKQEPVATEPVEPVAEPVEPVAEAVEPVAEPAAEPVEPVAEPVAEPVEPVAEPSAEPVEPVATEPVEPVAEPVEPVATEPVEPVAEPVEPVAEPAAEPVEPVATEPVEPVAEPVEPVAEPAAEPVEPVATEPVATEPVEPVAEPVEPVAEPVEPVATEPVEPVVAKEDEERVPEVQQEEEVDLDFGENDPNAPWNHMEKNPLDTEEFSNLCHGWGTFYFFIGT